MYQLIKDIDLGYTIQKSNCVKRVPDNSFIPFDPANTDYANFKKDLANGAELQDADGNVIDGIAYLKELA
jgi:hypothetical protein